MSDIITYIFYVGLLSVIVFSTHYLGNKKLKSEKVYDPNKLNIFYGFLIILISFFVGFRFEVGVDWEGYVTNFNLLTSNTIFNYSDQYYEIGFYLINWLVGVLGLGYQWMFFISALLSWYFYFKSVPKFILPLFIFFLFADGHFFWGMNGVRQFIAIAIWIYSIKFIIDKDLKYFITYIFLASLFHLSSLLLLPLYFIPYEKLYNQYYWILIYFSTLAITFMVDMSIIYERLNLIILVLSDYIGVTERYVRYVEGNKVVAEEKSLGLGFLFRILINLFLIIVSKNIVDKNSKMKIYFILFFIGAISFNIFYEFQLIGRLYNYLLIIRPLLLAYIVYYYWRSKNTKLLSLIIVIIYILFFINIIYQNVNMCCPYNIKII